MVVWAIVFALRKREVCKIKNWQELMIYLMWRDRKGELGIKDDSLWIFDDNVEMKDHLIKCKTRRGINLVGIWIKISILDMFEMLMRHVSLLLGKVFRHMTCCSKERFELEVYIWPVKLKTQVLANCWFLKMLCCIGLHL